MVSRVVPAIRLALSFHCDTHKHIHENHDHRLRWLERPAQRSLRERQNGVRFPWKLRRIPIAWPRDRHVEEH